MPLQRADNSFDSNDSKMVRSVEHDNFQGSGKFAEVFESASSEYNKMEKNDIEKKSKPAVKRSKNSDKQLEQKNGKLISLRKIRPNQLKSELKKTKKTKKNEKIENPTGNISTKIEIIGVGNIKTEEILTDNYGDGVIINPEDKSAELSLIPNIVNFSAEFNEAGSPEKLKGSGLLKSVSDRNKNSIDRKNTIKKDSGTSKGKISVLDLRHSEVKNSKARQAELTAENESQKFSIENSEQGNSEKTEEAKPIVIELTHIKDNFSSESKTLTTTSSSALMKQLEENINGKIVKQSSVILKDGGSGEIKLILKPEQLGSVRIRLSLTDKNITGQIIVDSSAVKDIFEQNLQNLERAFKENGFDTAALNVSVGGDQTGSSNKERESDISKQIELIDEIIPTMISESENLIDLVV